MNQTSNTATRQRILIAVALAILGIYALFSVRSARSAGQRLEAAQQDLNEIRQKLAEIDQLQQAPRVAALDTESPDAIGNRVDQSFETAGLPTSTLKTLTVGDAQETRNKDFKRRKVVINLEPSTLKSMVEFCDALRDEATGSIVSDLSLTTPSNSAGQVKREVWEAELTLTQIIFSPTSR